MSDETAGPAPDATVSSTETSGTEAPAESSQTTAADPNDFDTRLRSDPEFSAKFAKEQQAAASRANDRLRKADLAIQIAERLGGGDLAKGSEQALTELMLLRSMREHPEMQRFIERFQSGQPLAPPSDANGSDYPGFAEPEDAREKQLQSLQGTVARLETTVSTGRAVDAFKSFAVTEYGKLMTKEELSELFDTFGAQSRAWAATPDGRERLLKLTDADVQTIALHHLGTNGKLLELGERRARQRADELRSRETDVPSRMNAGGVPATSKVGAHRPGSEAAAVEAWREAKRALGLG